MPALKIDKSGPMDVPKDDKPHKAAVYAVLAHPHSHKTAIPAGSVASVPVQFPNIRGDFLIEGAPTGAEFEVLPAVQRYRRGETWTH